LLPLLLNGTIGIFCTELAATIVELPCRSLRFERFDAGIRIDDVVGWGILGVDVAQDTAEVGGGP